MNCKTLPSTSVRAGEGRMDGTGRGAAGGRAGPVPHACAGSAHRQAGGWRPPRPSPVQPRPAPPASPAAGARLGGAAPPRRSPVRRRRRRGGARRGGAERGRRGPGRSKSSGGGQVDFSAGDPRRRAPYAPAAAGPGLPSLRAVDRSPPSRPPPLPPPSTPGRPGGALCGELRERAWPRWEEAACLPRRCGSHPSGR